MQMRVMLLSAAMLAGVSTMAEARHGVHHHGHRSHHHMHHRHHHHHARRQPLEIRPQAQVASTKLIRIARAYEGRGNVTGFRGPWCGAFLGMVARKGGVHVPEGYRLAANWAHYGRRIARPVVGAVAVERHHVSLVTAVLGNGRIRTINGNYGHRVREATMSTSGKVFVQLASF